MKFVIRLIICVLAVAGGTVSAAPGDIYIVDKQHPQASDSNPGSASQPWKTIQHAANTLGPGETVLVKAGVYTEVNSDSAVDNPGIIVRVNGTESQPVTIRNFPGDRPIVDQGGNSDSVGFINKTGYMNYVVISGFEIRNTGTAGVFMAWGNVKGLVVENNYIHHVNGNAGGNVNGIKVWGARDPVLRSNIIHTIAVAGNTRNQNAACIGTYEGLRMKVEFNDLSDCYAGVYLKRPNFDQDTTAFVRSNIIHDVSVGVRISESGSNGPPHYNEVVAENLMYDISYVGVVADAGETSSPSDGLDIINNTIISNNLGIQVKRYRDVVIYNNIIASPNANIAEYSNSSDSNAVTFNEVNYNLFGNSQKFQLGVYSSRQKSFSSLSAWKDFTGWDNDSIAGDPQFFNPAGLDFNLRESSPAIGAGKNGENIGAYKDSTSLPGPQNRPQPPTGVTIN